RPMIGFEMNDVRDCTVNKSPTSPALRPTETPYSGKNAIKAPLAIILAASVELVINTLRFLATMVKPFHISAQTEAGPLSCPRGGGGKDGDCKTSRSPRSR